jgi:hypothetical protein
MLIIPTQVLLDFFALGSASIAAVHWLRPLFLSITAVLLVDRIRRQGFAKSTLLQVILSGSALLLPALFTRLSKPEAEALKHPPCH